MATSAQWTQLEEYRQLLPEYEQRNSAYEKDLAALREAQQKADPMDAEEKARLDAEKARLEAEYVEIAKMYSRLVELRQGLAQTRDAAAV